MVKWDRKEVSTKIVLKSAIGNLDSASGMVAVELGRYWIETGVSMHVGLTNESITYWEEVT